VSECVSWVGSLKMMIFAVEHWFLAFFHSKVSGFPGIDVTLCNANIITSL
jgi:hypothetical protein